MRSDSTVFEIRPELKSIQVKREQIVALIESINNPMVAAANRPLEPAKAIILGVRNPSGLFSIYVYLHLPESNACLVYLHDSEEVPLEAYRETEMEAIQFVESMGFMLDNVNFRNLAPQQQTALMETLPLFYDNLQAFDRRIKSSQGMGEASNEGEADIPLLEENVIELEEVADASEPSPSNVPVIPQEGLAKIIRLLSSF